MLQETALGILKSGRNVYLTGAAGAGKTYVLNEYINYLKKHNVGIGITASTGIAATHLNGMTIHSWSGIGIKDYLSDWDLDAMTQRKPLVKRITNTDVLIIDEVSMLRPEILDMIEMVLRTIKGVNEPFGGIQIVLSGDFFQLPPVVRGMSESSEGMFVDSSQAWRMGDFRVCYLSEQFRQKDGTLLTLLNDIRSTEISEVTKECIEEKLGEAKENSESDAIILHTHNENVNERNAQELKQISGKSKIYEMTTSGRKNIVETLKKSVLAPECLELKVGARVMFVKNSPEGEYVNGTMGEVTSLDGEYPIVKTYDGTEIVARPVSWEVIDDGKILASATQVPLRLAWAITVHKSQGMSLDAVEIDLSRAFTPGQGYVALSRARTIEGLVIKGINNTALSVHPTVKEQDEVLKEQSEHWEEVWQSFSAEKIKKLQDEFIKRVGRSETEAKQRESVPTHIKTYNLIVEGATIDEVRTLRSLTKGTIIGHLEKIKEGGDKKVYEHIKPKESSIKEIKKAFEKSKDTKLAPVHKLLKGKYTYEEIRLARLFI